MILSYHPCFVADENRLCAGRSPDETDRELIRAADAVILPQGCYRSLFETAHAHAERIFPNYAARFAYPGKTGQIRLFAEHRAPHPESRCFDSLDAFFAAGHSMPPETAPFDYPFVFKFSWSGEGANVRRIEHRAAFAEALEKAAACERTGQSGFVLQRYVETGGRSLRVVVIGTTCLSYWRLQPDPARFGTALADGALIDHEALPELQEAGRRCVSDFCRQTGIDLAGFDLLFDTRDPERIPLFLEINYFFGRRGLGGSDRFYALLETEIHRWLARHKLKVRS